MTYEEFEWHILRLVYDEGLERIQPAYIAYALGIPHDTASDYLDRAAESGVLEMEVTQDGRLEYYVPGAESEADMPAPIWKDGPDGSADEAEASAATDPVEQDEPSDQPHDEPDTSDASRVGTAESSGPPAESTPPVADAPAGEPARLASDGAGAEADGPASRGPDGTVDRPSAVPAVAEGEPDLPSGLQEHVEDRRRQADGTVQATATAEGAVVDRDVTVDSDRHPPVIQALEDSDRDLPIRIESTEETFSDPSQTIFMRQLRVHGVESEAALREHVHRLFDSMGYQIVDSDDERMRFERGSVTFILALVPLFVLVLPLFVYLFLYCMGRSTIHQEPLELDVQLRKNQERDDVYDIDLTFIGLHGVVLGTADQRVLDEEVDTLRDELRWALTTG